MTARGAVGRQKERGRPAIILAEPSRPAEGGTTRFGGNPEEQRQPPWACTHQQQDDPPLWVRQGASIQVLADTGLPWACRLPWQRG